jgi:hypothetical protein
VQRLENLTPLWLDTRGDLLDAGKIYIGTAGADPETSPKVVYWDGGLTQVAAQPLRTLGGVIMNGENPANVYFGDGDFSQRVRDADDVIVTAYSFSSAAAVTGTSGGGGTAYQPLDSDLTAIAALATTAYGRSLLTLVNQAALQAAVGNTGGSVQKTGDTMTGNLVRSGAGVHAYFADAAMTGGRIFITAVGASDPTSQPGDLWLQF